MSTLQEKADKVVTNESFSQLKRSILRMNAYMEGDTTLCRCRSCLRQSIEEANSWIAFTEDDFDTDHTGRYELIIDSYGTTPTFISMDRRRMR